MRRILTSLLVVGAIGLAAFLLYRTFSRYDLDEMMEALASIPAWRLAAAGGFAAASYLCLTGFDTLAVRYVGKRLPYWQTALASFTALSLGHNIGLAALSSGAVRYRFYSRWGLSAAEIAKVVVFCGVTVGLGLATLGGASLLLRADLGEELSGLQRGGVLLLGTGLVLAPAAYVLLASFYQGRIGYGRWSLEMPPLRLAIAQVAIGTLNFAMVAACLHQTLAAVSDAGFTTVASVYAIANATAIISHVPGGLGVIESVVLYVLPGAQVFAALIAFRVIYFFIPLIFGGTTFAISELSLRDRGSKATAGSRPESATTGSAVSQAR